MKPSLLLIIFICAIPMLALAQEGHGGSTASSRDAESGAAMIDRLIRIDWNQHGLAPGQKTEDWEFLRRSTLDILGRLPYPEEYDKFFAANPDQRRHVWCDYLVEHPDLPSYWGPFWEEALLGELPSAGYADFFGKGLSDWKKTTFRMLDGDMAPSLRGTLAGDKVAAEKRFDEGQTTMVPMAERTSQLLLGSSIQCAQCHDHMFEPFGQEDFWGLTAFFRAKANGKTPDYVSFKTPEGVEEKAPKAFFGKLLENEQKISNLFMDDPRFSKAIVNRVWTQLFGLSMNAPHRASQIGDPRKAVNTPALLDELATRFAREGYDQRKLMSWICNSSVYSLQSDGVKDNNETAHQHFAVASHKTITNPQLRRVFNQMSKLARNRTVPFSRTDLDAAAFPKDFAVDTAEEISSHSFLYLTNNENLSSFLKGFWKETLASRPFTKAEAIQHAARFLYGKDLPEPVLASVVKNSGELSPATMAEITTTLMSSRFFLTNR